MRTRLEARLMSVSCKLLLLLPLLLFLHPYQVLAAEWLDTQEHDSVVYFLFDSPPEVHRYDLDSESFLSKISLPGSDAATAFTVDEDGLYVAFGRRITHYNLNGSNDVHLTNTSANIKNVRTTDLNIYINYADSFISMEKSTIPF